MLERLLKGLTAVALIAITALILITDRRHGGGIVIGFPILAAVLLWDTICLVTRRRSIFKMEVLWPAMIGCIGLGPALVVLTLDVGINAELDPAVIRLLILWAVPWAALGFRGGGAPLMVLTSCAGQRRALHPTPVSGCH